MEQSLFSVGQTTTAVSTVNNEAGNTSVKAAPASSFSSTLDAHVKKQGHTEKTTQTVQNQSETKVTKQDKSGHENEQTGKALPAEQEYAENVSEIKAVLSADADAQLVSADAETDEKVADMQTHDEQDAVQSEFALTDWSVVIGGQSSQDSSSPTPSESQKTIPIRQTETLLTEPGKAIKSETMTPQQLSLFKPSTLPSDRTTITSAQTEQQADVDPVLRNNQKEGATLSFQFSPIDTQKQTKILSSLIKDNSNLESGQRGAATNSVFSSSLTMTASEAGSQSRVAAPSVLHIQPAVHSEAWGKVMSSRIIWMAKEGVQQAELRLNPAHLGPVEVRLHLHQDQANITFLAPHAATRDALEHALPRLRDSFQENGMNLADANVSDQAAQQQTDRGEGQDSSAMHQSDLRRQDEGLIGGDSGEGRQTNVNVQEIGVSVYA